MNLNQGTSPRWESTSFVFLFLFVSTSVKNRSELKAIRAIFCVFVSKTFNCIFQASKRSKEAKVIFLQKIFKNPFFNLIFFISISTPTPFRQMALTLFDPLPPPSETFSFFSIFLQKQRFHSFLGA